MSIGKQAKILTTKQEKIIIAHLLSNTRLPEKNLAIFLLSIKAGLRAKEISQIEWQDVLDSDDEVGELLIIRDEVSKGKNGGRIIPMNAELRQALINLYEIRRHFVNADWKIIYSQSGNCVRANSLAVWFHKLYKDLSIDGASSHSGRRTMITRSARKISTVGGSLKDIQELAGHSSLANTQRYIQGSETAKRKIVELV
jgi:integrase